MESEYRMVSACLRPRVLLLQLLFWGLVSLRVLGITLLGEEKLSAPGVTVTPCWQLEEFVVSAECSRCNAFQSMSSVACRPTGYVETINCPKSKKEEYKSCRSALLDEQLFWKFEGAMLGLSVIFGVLVVMRQRSLDRLASEKVRRQIQSI